MLEIVKLTASVVWAVTIELGYRWCEEMETATPLCHISIVMPPREGSKTPEDTRSTKINWREGGKGVKTNPQ